MEEKRNIEEIILNGTEDELSQLRLWLFKESCRLENMESSLAEKYERLEAEEMAFKERMDQAERKLENLNRKLNNDKKKLESEFIRLEREKSYQRENEYDALDLLFRGVNNPLALKKRYKDLMKMFHPDNISGDAAMVQLINQEYSALCRQFDIGMYS